MKNDIITRKPVGRPRAVSAGGVIAEWISDYLEREGLTVSLAADRIGVGQGTLSDWLRGVKNPGMGAITSLISMGMPVEIYREHVAHAAEKRLSERR